jgi:hypothetical protein
VSPDSNYFEIKFSFVSKDIQFLSKQVQEFHIETAVDWLLLKSMIAIVAVRPNNDDNFLPGSLNEAHFSI